MEQVLDTQLLIIEKYKSNVTDLKTRLSELNFKNITCTTPEQALEHIREKHFDIIFYKQDQFTEENLKLVEQVQNLYLEIPIILVSKTISPDCMRLAIRFGSYDFLHEPFELFEVVSKLLQNWVRLLREAMGIASLSSKL